MKKNGGHKNIITTVMKKHILFVILCVITLMLVHVILAQETSPEKLTKDQLEKMPDDELVRIAEKLDPTEVAKLSTDKLSIVINHMGDRVAELPPDRLNEEKIMKVLTQQTIVNVHDKIEDITKLPRKELEKAFSDSMEIDLALAQGAKDITWHGGSLVTKMMSQNVENLGEEFVVAKVDNDGTITLITDKKTEVEVRGKGIVNKGDIEHPLYDSKDPFVVRASGEETLSINGKEISMYAGGAVGYAMNKYIVKSNAKITDNELGVAFEVKAGEMERFVEFGTLDEPTAQNMIHIGKNDGELIIKGTGEGRLVIFDEHGKPHATIVFDDGKPFLDRQVWLENKDKPFERDVTINDIDLDDLGVKMSKSRVSYATEDARERITELLDQRRGNMRQKYLELAKAEFMTEHGRMPTEQELNAELHKVVERKVNNLLAIQGESIHQAAVESIRGAPSIITLGGSGLTFKSIEEMKKAEEAAMNAAEEHLSMDNFKTREQMVDFLTRMEVDEKKSITNPFERVPMSTLEKVKLWRAVEESQRELATVQGFFQRRTDDSDYQPTEQDVKTVVEAQRKLSERLGSDWERIVRGQLHIGLLSESETYQDAVELARKADPWVEELAKGTERILKDTYSTAISKRLTDSMLSELKDYEKLELDKNPQLLPYYQNPETRSLLLAAAEKKPVTVYDSNQKLSFLRFADTVSVTDTHGEVIGRLKVTQKEEGVYELESHSLDLPRGKNDFRLSSSLVSRIVPEKYSAMKELFNDMPGEGKAEMLKTAFTLMGNSPESFDFSLEEARRNKEVGVHTEHGGIGGLFEKLSLLKNIKKVPEGYKENAQRAAESAMGTIDGQEVPIPTDSAIEVKPRNEQYSTIRTIAQLGREIEESDDLSTTLEKVKKTKTDSLLTFVTENKDVLPLSPAQQKRVTHIVDYVHQTTVQHPELDKQKLRDIADDAIKFTIGPAVGVVLPMEESNDRIYFSSDGRVLIYVNGRVKVYPYAYADYIKGFGKIK